MEVNPLIAFGAGLISIFSPCVLPLLPAIVASSTNRGKLRPIAIVLGLSISFTTMGLVASAFGAAFTAYSSYLFAAAILLIIAMGFWMLFDLHLPYNAPRLGLLDRVSRKTYDIPTEGIASGLVLGLALGIVWLPCTGPVLATILTWVAANGDVVTGGLLLLVYSLGFAVPMLAIAYSARLSSSLVGKSSKTIWIKRVAGVVLIAVGVYLAIPYLPMLTQI
ncbi:MAG: cytochrome c biogenesis CcdA family protein [Halobacteriota archaeon]